MTVTNIQALKELVPVLSGILVSESVSGDYHEYQCSSGGPFREVIVFRSKNVLVGRDWAPAGSVAFEHRHTKSIEYFIVVKGRVRCHMDGKFVDAKAGEHIYIPKDTPHSCEALTELAMLSIMIPAEEGI